MAFDPDAYLAGGTVPEFDPDAYLAATPSPSPAAIAEPAPAEKKGFLAKLKRGLGIQDYEEPSLVSGPELTQVGVETEKGWPTFVRHAVERASHVVPTSWSELGGLAESFVPPIEAYRQAKQGYQIATGTPPEQAMPGIDELKHLEDVKNQFGGDSPEYQAAAGDVAGDILPQMIMAGILGKSLKVSPPSHIVGPQPAPELPPSPTLGPGTTAADVSAAIKAMPPEVPQAERITQPRVERELPATEEKFNPETLQREPKTDRDFWVDGSELRDSVVNGLRRLGVDVAKTDLPSPEQFTNGKDFFYSMREAEMKMRQSGAKAAGFVFEDRGYKPPSAAAPAPAPVQPPEALPAPEAAAPMTQMFSAKGATDILYDKAFEALQRGENTISGVRDPILARHKAAFDRGEITSPANLKIAEEGKGVGGITPEAAARAAAEPPAGAGAPPTPPVEPPAVPSVPPEDVRFTREGAGEPIPQAYSDEPHVSAIANRFVAERAARGELGEVQPGGTISTMDLVHQGLKMGPEEVNQSVSRIMQGGDVTTRDATAIRGEEARLSQRSNELSRAARTSPEAQLAADNAFKDLTDFHNGPIAALKRNWHLQGKAMQGEIPVDLSTLNGMREAWLKDTGKPPPAHVEPKLQKAADKLAKAIDEERTAARNGGEAIDRVTRGRKLLTPEELRLKVTEKMKIEPCIT